MIYRVAPMKELWHLGSTAPGAQIKHLGQRHYTCGYSQD